MATIARVAVTLDAWGLCKAALPADARLTVRERENGTAEAFAQDVATHQALGFAYGSTPGAALMELRDYLVHKAEAP